MRTFFPIFTPADLYNARFNPKQRVVGRRCTAIATICNMVLFITLAYLIFDDMYIPNILFLYSDYNITKLVYPFG